MGPVERSSIHTCHSIGIIQGVRLFPVIPLDIIEATYLLADPLICGFAAFLSWGFAICQVSIAGRFFHLSSHLYHCRCHCHLNIFIAIFFVIAIVIIVILQFDKFPNEDASLVFFVDTNNQKTVLSTVDFEIIRIHES